MATHGSYAPPLLVVLGARATYGEDEKLVDQEHLLFLFLPILRDDIMMGGGDIDIRLESDAVQLMVWLWVTHDEDSVGSLGLKGRPFG